MALCLPNILLCHIWMVTVPLMTLGMQSTLGEVTRYLLSGPHAAARLSLKFTCCKPEDT